MLRAYGWIVKTKMQRGWKMVLWSTARTRGESIAAFIQQTAGNTNSIGWWHQDQAEGKVRCVRVCLTSLM